MNPFMAGNGQMPNVPTTKELWKDEKSKFRLWIILYPISLLIVFGILLAGMIMYATNYDGVHDSIKAYLIDDGLTDTQADTYISSFAWMSLKALPIGVLCLIGASFVGYLLSISTAYKEHNFGKIPVWSTSLGFVVMMLAFFTMWRHGAYMQTPETKMIFAGQMCGIVVGICSYPVGRIVKLFMYADRMEKMKNDPQFQAMQQKIQEFMNFQAGRPNTPQNPQSPQAGANSNVHPTGVGPATGAPTAANQQVVEPEVSKEKKMLQEMDLETLRVVAKKYSISGANKMEKEELVETILRISGQK